MDKKKSIKIFAIIAVIFFIGLLFGLSASGDKIVRDNKRLKTIKNMEMCNAEDVRLMINYTNDFDFVNSGRVMESSDLKDDGFLYIAEFNTMSESEKAVGLLFLNSKKNDVYSGIDERSAWVWNIIWSVVYVSFMAVVAMIFYMAYLYGVLEKRTSEMLENIGKRRSTLMSSDVFHTLPIPTEDEGEDDG